MLGGFGFGGFGCRKASAVAGEPPVPPSTEMVPASPVVDQSASDSASHAGQWTLVWALPTLLADLSTAVDTITTQTVYFKQDTGDGLAAAEVRLGSAGSGVTAVTVSAAATSYNRTSVSAGTYFVGVSANNSLGESDVSGLYMAVVT